MERAVNLKMLFLILTTLSTDLKKLFSQKSLLRSRIWKSFAESRSGRPISSGFERKSWYYLLPMFFLFCMMASSWSSLVSSSTYASPLGLSLHTKEKYNVVNPEWFFSDPDLTTFQLIADPKWDFSNIFDINFTFVFLLCKCVSCSLWRDLFF